MQDIAINTCWKGKWPVCKNVAKTILNVKMTWWAASNCYPLGFCLDFVNKLISSNDIAAPEMLLVLKVDKIDQKCNFV